jgi:hypothetical protein
MHALWRPSAQRSSLKLAVLVLARELEPESPNFSSIFASSNAFEVAKSTIKPFVRLCLPADKLAALGLACSVMQLISFSKEAISVARQAYAGVSIDDDLNDRARRLSQMSKNVKSSFQKLQSSARLPGQKQLLDAAQKCHAASLELGTEIDKLGASMGKRHAGRAIVVPMKTMMKKRRIERLEKTILQWQNVMDSGLLFRVW